MACVVSVGNQDPNNAGSCVPLRYTILWCTAGAPRYVAPPLTHSYRQLLTLARRRSDDPIRAKGRQPPPPPDPVNFIVDGHSLNRPSSGQHRHLLSRTNRRRPPWQLQIKATMAVRSGAPSSRKQQQPEQIKPSTHGNQGSSDQMHPTWASNRHQQHERSDSEQHSEPTVSMGGQPPWRHHFSAEQKHPARQSTNPSNHLRSRSG
ncbi:hypothetical protein ACLOJK_039213 [Asimina triloba]